MNGQYGKVAAFLDIYHPARKIFEKFVKDKQKPKVQTHLFRWDADDPLSDLLLSRVGQYPAKSEIGIDYAEYVQKQLKATVEKLDPAKPLPEKLYRLLTPNRLTEWNIEVYGGSHWKTPGVYVGRADDFEDLMNFWNLRAAEIDLLFYDKRYDARIRPEVDGFLATIRKRSEGAERRPRPYWISLWTREQFPEEEVNFGENVGICGIDVGLWNGLNIVPGTVHLGDRHSVLASVNESYEIQSLAIELSKKPFYGDFSFHSQHLIVSLRIYGAASAGSSSTFSYPFIPELNEFYGREAGGHWNSIRAEPESVGIVIDAATTDLRLNAIPKQDLIAATFKAFGITCESSQPGRIASRLITQMGGIQGCRVFKIAGVRRLIENYGPLEHFTRSAAIQFIAELDPQTGHPNFDRYESLYLEPRDKPKLKPDDVLVYLLKRGIFRAGLNLKCPSCDLEFWVSLDDIGTEVPCEYCGKKFDITPQLRDRDWAYRRSGLFGRNDHQEGSIPVVVTLQQLDTVMHWDSVFTTNMNLQPNGADIAPCETDFVLMSWKFRTLDLAISECKSPGQEISDEDIENLTRVAKVFPKHRINVFIVFAKTGAFNDAEIARCKKAAESYFGDHGNSRIILLSQRELEPYFVYEWTEKEFDVRSTAVSLEDLARATRDIYFEPRPKHIGSTPISAE